MREKQERGNIDRERKRWSDRERMIERETEEMNDLGSKDRYLIYI